MPSVRLDSQMETNKFSRQKKKQGWERVRSGGGLGWEGWGGHMIGVAARVKTLSVDFSPFFPPSLSLPLLNVPLLSSLALPDSLTSPLSLSLSIHLAERRSPRLIMPVIGVTHTFPVCLHQIKNIVSVFFRRHGLRWRN